MIHSTKLTWFNWFVRWRKKNIFVLVKKTCERMRMNVITTNCSGERICTSVNLIIQLQQTQQKFVVLKLFKLDKTKSWEMRQKCR